MKIVRPTQVVDATIVETDIPSEGYAEYNPATTYALDVFAQVSTGSGDFVYKSLQAGNTNHTPAASPEWWLYMGPTNEWGMFDASVGTGTSQADSFYYILEFTGRVDSMVLLGVEAAEVILEVLNDEVFEEVGTYGMVSTSGIQDIYAYYTEEVVLKKTLVALDLPTYLNPTYRLTINYPGATASVGCAVFGRQRALGRTQYGTSVGITDFSKKDEDAFGGFIVQEKPYRDRGSFNVKISNGFVDECKRLLTQYRAKPLVYIGTECFEATTMYGYYRDFTIGLDDASESSCNIEVESVT